MSYLSEVLADNPLCYYRFNELTGLLAADSSGNGRDGAYQPSGITLGVTGATNISDSGKAVTFTDPASYMDSGLDGVLSPGTGDFTIECWIKRTLPDLIASIVGKAPVGAGNSIEVALDNLGKINFNLNGGTLSGGVTVSDNAFHHIVALRNGGVTRIYVDGALDQSGSISGAISPSATMLVGRKNKDDILLTGFATGTIDEVAWYGTALSLARIQAHFTAATTAPPPTPPTVDNSIPLAYFWPSRS
jgi:hypothetical protein